MKGVLQSHFARYPLMRLDDMVKLICQSEFAGGHMIGSPAESLQALEDECAALPPGCPAAPVEDIGGGLCRVHLGALESLGVRPATLCRLFVATANGARGSMARCVEKLKALRQCCERGALPFSPAEADGWLLRMQGSACCPPLRHSEAYRGAYRPAYRVVKAAYACFIGVFARIDALMERKKRLVIAIDGCAASGKTTLAGLLAEVYGCAVLHMDHFFLPPHRKTPARLAAPGGNVDHERFAAEAFPGLKSGAPFSYRPFDCRAGGYAKPVAIRPGPLSVVEGAYSLHPAFAGLYDLRLFMRTDAQTQAERIRRRSGDAMLARFTNEWIPLENAYFDAFHIASSCDMVLNTSKRRSLSG